MSVETFNFQLKLNWKRIYTVFKLRVIYLLYIEWDNLFHIIFAIYILNDGNKCMFNWVYILWKKKTK